MTEERPAIPAELRRRVLVEAGHRCAIPKCRYIETDVHHIIPWETCRSHEYENLIALCPNCHRRANNGDIDRKALKIYKANLRYTHDRFSQLEVDMLFDLYSKPINHHEPWPPYLMLLIKRVFEAGYVERRQNPQGSASSFGMQISPDFLVLTTKGWHFVDSLALEQDTGLYR